MSPTVTVRLPTGWAEIDPREADVVGELERALGIAPDAHEAAVALLAPLAADLSRSAATTDIVLAAFFGRAIEREGAEPLVLTANLLLAVSPPLAGGAQAGLSLPGTVEPVDLPAGAAVLATDQVEIRGPHWDAPVAARRRRYVVSVPNSEQVVVLHFQTPNVDLADQFDDVFAAIAETLTFDPPDSEPPDSEPPTDGAKP